MDKEDQPKITREPVSLLLVEGATDEIFFRRVKALYLADCRATVKDLEGLFNINAKVINSVGSYCRSHRDERVRVYCCFDRESRYGEVPGFDMRGIEQYIRKENVTSVLILDLVKATKQIESWFFYDIHGIYKFLRAPKTQRNTDAFKPPERFGYRDLQHLFERYGKTYTKGRRAANFINHLNFEKIVSQCQELQAGIELIKSQAGNVASRLF